MSSEFFRMSSEFFRMSSEFLSEFFRMSSEFFRMSSEFFRMSRSLDRFGVGDGLDLELLHRLFEHQDVGAVFADRGFQDVEPTLDPLKPILDGGQDLLSAQHHRLAQELDLGLEVFEDDANLVKADADLLEGDRIIRRVGHHPINRQRRGAWQGWGGQRNEKRGDPRLVTR
jgi:hypothetical protein